MDPEDFAATVRDASKVHIYGLESRDEIKTIMPIQAKRVAISISGNASFTLNELHAISDKIVPKFGQNASIIWGFRLSEKGRITIIAAE